MADFFTPKGSLGAALVALGLLTASPSVARADAPQPISADDAQNLANEIDVEIGHMRKDLDAVGKGFVASPVAEVNRVERRLSEGEIQFMLADYLRASIVLLDVVEDPTAKSQPKYDDCVYLLAESLRKSKNYGGARGYFEDLLPRAKGERLKDVVLALLEIASATDRYENVEHYIERLREAGNLSRPDVDYIYGKMLFKGAGSSTAKVQRAYEVFRSIPDGNSVAPQASYFAGVALVRLNRYDDAIRQFTETLGRVPKTKDGERLRELTQLSLGRLYQEVGDTTKSTLAYQEISQTSPYFGDMLFEVAWAHVRAANLAKDPEERKQSLVRALRATEILMATVPSSRLYPQARILQGNLQIRLDAPEGAYDTFQAIIDRYGSAKDKLLEILQQTPDPKQFFDQLIAADLHNVGATTVLPPVVLEWALDEDEMHVAVGMSEDLSDSRKNLKESQELVRTLSEALTGEQKYGLIPGMQPIRTRSLSIENRLVNANRRLLNLDRRITAPFLGSNDLAQLDQLHARLAALEGEIQKLPQTDQEVESTKQAIKEQFDDVGLKAYRETYRVSSLRAQIVAVETWINQNRDKLSAEETNLLEARVAEAGKDVAELQSSLEGIQGDIRTAAVVANVDGGRMRAQALRQSYGQLLAQEIAMVHSFRDRVPGGLAAVATRTDQQRASLQQIDQDLQQLQASLDQQVGKRVDEIKASIALEADRLVKYAAEQQDLSTSADGMLGPLATKTLGNVGKEFKNFVLQADVGIIDVAWARKLAETKKVNDLLKEEQSKTSDLESEFADVLDEQ